MDFARPVGVATVSSGANGQQVGLSAENGPILYSESNRTSAIDDIISVVIYIFIITAFLGFFLILPGIRHERLPTFFCVSTSLIVTSIIVITLFGTTWHVGQAPISAAYKAFSRDRIQGDLSVMIGLNSVNITLKAHKYYLLHATHGPMMMTMMDTKSNKDQSSSEADNGSRSSDFDELFTTSASASGDQNRLRRSSPSTSESPSNKTLSSSQQRRPKYIVKQVNVDINYNERFYWIEPNQMRQEHHHALQRGLPYPILTVVEYLSQDEAGFNWSRQYRLAGYYTSMLLWLALSASVVMFILHCAAPKYGIYAMQLIGCILLLTNLTYSTLVPKGDQKLVIPFEGRPLGFEFGHNFWLVLFGGCLAIVIGTVIVIVDWMFPNFYFTTILDLNFDLNHQNDIVHHHYHYSKRPLRNNNGRPPITAGSFTTENSNNQLGIESSSSSPPIDHKSSAHDLSEATKSPISSSPTISSSSRASIVSTTSTLSLSGDHNQTLTSTNTDTDTDNSQLSLNRRMRSLQTKSQVRLRGLSSSVAARSMAANRRQPIASSSVVSSSSSVKVGEHANPAGYGKVFAQTLRNSEAASVKLNMTNSDTTPTPSGALVMQQHPGDGLNKRKTGLDNNTTTATNGDNLHRYSSHL